MTRFKASFTATDMGLAECVIMEVGRDGSEEKLYGFLLELSAPDARGALIGALAAALDKLERKESDGKVRDGYLVKLRTNGTKVDCYTRRTGLSESEELVECEFDIFTVTGNPGQGSRDAMDVALCAVRGRLHGNDNPSIVG